MSKPEEVKEETKEAKKERFNYENSLSFKVSDKFKERFNTKTAGNQETMSSDGLIALAHIKGMWKCESKIIQFPNASNNNVCICEAFVGGYDWDPIENKVIRVEYTDIGDASPANCNKMVAPSFIRMASTRAIGRALRKYLNIDMLCTEELSEEDINTDTVHDMMSERISQDQLTKIKSIVVQKNINEQIFNEIMSKTFGTTDFQMLNMAQGNQLITILSNYIGNFKP